MPKPPNLNDSCRRRICVSAGYCSDDSSRDDPLFVIDGKPFLEFATDTLCIPTFDPNDIEGVTLIRGVSAMPEFGPAARAGAVLITTKSHPEIRCRSDADAPARTPHDSSSPPHSRSDPR